MYHYTNLLSVLYETNARYNFNKPSLRFSFSGMRLDSILDEFDSADNMNEAKMKLHHYAREFDIYNQKFEHIMEEQTNLIHNNERRIIDAFRVGEAGTRIDQNDPLKWAKQLVEKIEDFTLYRWTSGWQSCIIPLMKIRNEVECLFLDGTYDNCPRGRLGFKNELFKEQEEEKKEAQARILVMAENIKLDRSLRI